MNRLLRVDRFSSERFLRLLLVLHLVHCMARLMLRGKIFLLFIEDSSLRRSELRFVYVSCRPLCRSSLCWFVGLFVFGCCCCCSLLFILCVSLRPSLFLSLFVPSFVRSFSDFVIGFESRSFPLLFFFFFFGSFSLFFLLYVSFSSNHVVHLIVVCLFVFVFACTCSRMGWYRSSR